MQGAGQAAPTPRSAHHLGGSTRGGLQTSRWPLSHSYFPVSLALWAGSQVLSHCCASQRGSLMHLCACKQGESMEKAPEETSLNECLHPSRISTCYGMCRQHLEAASLWDALGKRCRGAGRSRSHKSVPDLLPGCVAVTLPSFLCVSLWLFQIVSFLSLFFFFKFIF